MRRGVPWALIMSLAVATFACSGGGGEGNGVALEHFAQIEIDPPERDVQLAVGALAIDESSTYNIALRNTGEDTLLVRSIELQYEHPVGVSEEEASFSMVPVEGLPKSLVDGDVLAINLRFVHNDRVPREAVVVVESNSRDDPRLEIVFQSYEGRPVALVSSDELDFGIVRVGQRRETPLTLLNNGQDVLSFTGFRLEGRGAYSFTDVDSVATWPNSLETESGVTFASPVALEPGRSRELRVSYEAADSEASEGLLVLTTDDPGVGQVIPVRLLANGRVPRLTVEPTSIDFGLVGIGVTKVRTVRLSVGGTAPLEIRSLALSDGSSFDFAVEYAGVVGLSGQAPSEQSPLFVRVNDSVDVPLSFVPNTQTEGPDGEPLADSGSLLIRTNAYEDVVVVPLTGTGIDARCPTPVLSVWEGDEVAPQTSLHLSGEESEAYCGTIDDWDWTATQPDGSVASFLPSPSFPTPVFTANVAGTYRFCLEVQDSCGIRSCEPACTDVIVIPDERIHVELLWSTPGDDNPSDEGPMLGADMDLHFLHPYAFLGGQDIDGDGQTDGWFDSTYDCFFGNPQPDWGSFEPSADDNPGLDRDDTDGAGPENVNLNVPEELSSLPPEVVATFDGATAAYHIGVHYWNDHGFGPSLATVRVYITGELVWERAEVQMSHRDLWRVGAVHWPEGFVEAFEGETGSPFIIESYEHPNWVVP